MTSAEDFLFHLKNSKIYMVLIFFLILRNCLILDVLYNFYNPGIYAEGYIVFAFPFVLSAVRMFVRHIRGIYDKVLCASFSSGVYLTNHSSESIHIWTIGTLEGRLSFHDS